MDENEVKQAVIDALKLLYDPELPIDIYNLGLIYHIHLKRIDDNRFAVLIVMTLTSVGCPEIDRLIAEVYARLNALSMIDSVEVSLVFDPPWTIEKMSDEGRMILQAMGYID